MNRGTKLYKVPDYCIDRSSGRLREELVEAAARSVVRKLPKVLDFFSLQQLMEEVSDKFLDHQMKNANLDQEPVDNIAAFLRKFSWHVAMNLQRKEGYKRSKDGAAILDWQIDRKKGPADTAGSADDLGFLMDHPDAGLTPRQYEVFAYFRTIPEDSCEGERLKWGAARFGIKPQNVRSLYREAEKKLRNLCCKIVDEKCVAWAKLALGMREAERLVESIPLLIDETWEVVSSRQLIFWIVAHVLIMKAEKTIIEQQPIDLRFRSAMDKYIPLGCSERNELTLVTASQWMGVQLLLSPSRVMRNMAFVHFYMVQLGLAKLAKSPKRAALLFSMTRHSSEVFQRSGYHQWSLSILDMGMELLEKSQHALELTRLDSIRKRYRAELI